MSFQKLKLPNAVIIDLFRHSLVKASREEAPDAALPGTDHPYRFLGGNLRRTCLLVSAPESFSVPEKHLSLLVRILEACKMTLADVAILNQASQEMDMSLLREQLDPVNMILFGVEPKEIHLPFNSPAFKIQEFDGCRYLYAPSMNDLNQDTEEGKILKSKLWVCLRKLFEV